MKFKAIIGAAVVLGTMMLASVTAHAATFTAGASNTADSDGRYALPVSVTTTSGESLNGVIIELEYDNTKIEMVEGPNSSYADMGSVCTGGVNVSSTKEKSSKTVGVVAWAAATANPITGGDGNVATVYFKPVNGFTGDATVDVKVQQIAYNATELGSAINGNGKVTVGGTVTFKFGDLDNNGIYTANDYQVLVNWTLDSSLYNDEQKKIADVNGDNVLSADDYTNLINKVLDATYVFPVEK